MAEYELVFIAQPTLEPEPLTALTDRITHSITDLKGQVNRADAWGKRRLAYPIKKQTEGFYYLLDMELPTTAVRTLEHNLRLMEDVLRYLVVRKTEFKR